ncbi:Dyp-type peroxidase [Psychromicrobium xiongbiense]|uniref:Dyp-type peroxidase n=1 Tax=Psychromicrobium xiongbiense TaxID=3051184 RepID=UPI0025531ED1|nr:Dyp-type peroxidase [Psychromicrobium sp. YIM S02556]
MTEKKLTPATEPAQASQNATQPAERSPHRLGRRSFLLGAGAGGATAALAATAIAALAPHGAPSAAAASAPEAVEFYGPTQAGVYRPADQQAHSCFAAFRVLAKDREELKSLFQTLTAKGARLAAGHRADTPILSTEMPVVSGGPPDDSGVLGEDVPPCSFSLTVALAASLFDNPAYGLAGKKPQGLTEMKTFPNDAPDEAWLGGDLLLQFCADSTDMIHFALRDVMKATRGTLQLQWKINGFHSAPRPSGAPRNLFGYKDGIVNPGPAEPLVWIEKNSGQPDWAVGGTFMVVRLIRMLVEFWDRVGLGEQDGMIGRERASGAPLGMKKETDIPDYSKDPQGEAIPLDAHIRLANPRTQETDGSRFLRRGYNYDLGIDLNGNMQAGLIFACYQRNIQEQFEAVQTRLINEPMTDYIQPFGGGYFIVLPGVSADQKDRGGYLGQGLFA